MIKLKLEYNDGISTDEVLTYLLKKYDVSKKKSVITLKPYDKEIIAILNKKETLILNYIADGLKYSEIALKMNISIDGVRYYVRSIFKKLNVNNAKKAIKELLK